MVIEMVIGSPILSLILTLILLTYDFSILVLSMVILNVDTVFEKLAP